MLMFQHEERRHIEATPQQLFELLADVERHDVLAGSDEVKAVRLLTEGQTGSGTQWEADEEVRFGKGRQSFTAQSQMRDFSPPTHLSWTSTPPGKPVPRRIEWSWTLTPAGTGTDVVERVEVDINPLMNVAMKLPYKRMRGTYVAEGMRRTLDRLEEHVRS
jgi:ribosome-associated toxin RatA of RatAB toxin-antitoxin module